MEKRYQVFISSTFQDLQNARQEVSQALLRADCFPAGMELFPAADEEQFEFIKTVIDQSDYYIIISAGRYGSIHPVTGLSFTEMEYDYAVETGKPVIRLLHKDPFNELKGEFIEKTAKSRKSLEKFRTKTSAARMVKYWSNEIELGSAVDHGLRHIMKTSPGVGWMRSSDVDKDLQLENYQLKEKIGNIVSDEERLERALELQLPLTVACMRKQFGHDGENKFAEVVDAVFDQRVLYETESEIVESLMGTGLSPANAEMLVAAMESERLIEFWEGFWKTTIYAKDAFNKIRLRVYLDQR